MLFECCFDWMLWKLGRFVVATEEKEKEENGLVLIFVLLSWDFKEGIRWVHLIQDTTSTLLSPRSVTVGLGDPNRSYFGVLDKQRRCGAGGVSQELVGVV